MKNIGLTVISAVVVILSASLVACGGGDKPSNPSINDHPDGSSKGSIATYLFYQGSDAGGIGGAIWAIDPATSASPVSVESSSVANVETVEDGAYDAVTHMLSDLHARTIIYAKDNKLWKISALKGGALSPVQLSNEAAANKICGSGVDEDFANHNNAVYIYSLPGPDGSCATSDDTRKMVKVGMSAAHAPISLGNIRPVTSIIDPLTGALKGWLATDGGSLNSYDANFASPSLKTIFTTGVRGLISGTTKIFLRIDDKLHVYNPETGSLSASRHTFSSAFTGYVDSKRDGNNFFFSDGNAIYKMSVDGDAPATQLVLENGAGSYGSLYLTDNKLVYVWYDNTTTTIKSVPKVGGTAQPLVDESTGEVLNIMAVDKGGWVYYGRQYGTPGRVAGAIKDDGAGGNEISNAMWVGGTYSRSGNLETVEGRFKRLILADGYNPASAFAGGALKSYDVLTNTPIAKIGTIPSNIEMMLFWGHETGGNMLGVGYTGAVGDPDIFSINTETQNSLRRITDTPTISEVPLS